MDKLKKQNSNSTGNQNINKTDLNALPEIVQLWLNKVGVVGKNRISAVNLIQTGLMKLDPEQSEWYKPQAEQFITVTEPGFLWQVDLAMLPVIKTKGRDLFYHGDSSMLIKIACCPLLTREQILRLMNQPCTDFYWNCPGTQPLL